MGILSENLFAAYPHGTISQPSCMYYNVTYPTFNKTISGPTEYIYKGCQATIQFDPADVYGMRSALVQEFLNLGVMTRRDVD